MVEMIVDCDQSLIGSSLDHDWAPLPNFSKIRRQTWLITLQALQCSADVVHSTSHAADRQRDTDTHRLAVWE